MEHCCPSPDRWQRRGEHRARAPVQRFFACGAPCFDRVAGAEHRSSHPHLDNFGCAARRPVRTYRYLGLQSRSFPATIFDPWVRVATKRIGILKACKTSSRSFVRLNRGASDSGPATCTYLPPLGLRSRSFPPTILLPRIPVAT